MRKNLRESEKSIREMRRQQYEGSGLESEKGDYISLSVHKCRSALMAPVTAIGVTAIGETVWKFLPNSLSSFLNL